MAKQERIYDVPIFIYVLELENGCYYVGQSINVVRRLAEHQAGTGAGWTRRNRPVRLLEVIFTGLFSSKAAERLEDWHTIRYMRAKGWAYVRGGCYFGAAQRVRHRLQAHALARPALHIDFSLI